MSVFVRLRGQLCMCLCVCVFLFHQIDKENKENKKNIPQKAGDGQGVCRGKRVGGGKCLIS